jgi:DNA-binding HxlR family transcriptional regulator
MLESSCMADHPTKLCTRYHHAVELLGRRWAGAILRILMDGSARYNELRTAIPEISDRMLAERLRELEAEGLLTRRVYPEVPVRVEYTLTEKGRGLEGPIAAIGRWADRWVPASEPSAADRDTPRLHGAGARARGTRSRRLRVSSRTPKRG